MVQELGETRERLGRDIWKKAEDFANEMKHVEKPFYIVYACKEDKAASERLGSLVLRQAFKAYFAKPPALLGILVWYVDNKIGEFSFKPELSAPPDVPIDPSMLSTNPDDCFERVAKQGQKLNALIS